MKKLYFKEYKGAVIDPCPFGERAMVGSINCQKCPHCLAMNDQNNWVICEKFNDKNEENEKRIFR